MRNAAQPACWPLSHRPLPLRTSDVWGSLSGSTFLPVCGYLGAGALVGLGVCVPAVNVPGTRGVREEPAFLLGTPDGEKRPPATSPTLFDQCWVLGQAPGRVLRMQKRGRERTDNAGATSAQEAKGPSHQCLCCHVWCPGKPADTGASDGTL